MAKARRKKDISKADIISGFMEYSLAEDQSVYNTYKFTKHLNIEEGDIYKHFGSLQQIERSVWDELLRSAIDTVNADEQTQSMPPYDRVLALLYTVFENFTLNRTFLLESLNRHKGLVARQDLWKVMRGTFATFIAEAFQKEEMSVVESETLEKVRKKGQKEGAWAHFIFLIDYWSKDESPGFEKTDIAIEKSIKATRDLLDVTPVRSLMDFGKFLFQDKFADSPKS